MHRTHSFVYVRRMMFPSPFRAVEWQIRLNITTLRVDLAADYAERVAARRHARDWAASAGVEEEPRGAFDLLWSHRIEWDAHASQILPSPRHTPFGGTGSVRHVTWHAEAKKGEHSSHDVPERVVQVLNAGSSCV
eukprot:scaffold49856_cov36-Phaeocystis_antarctica.AAC.2